ncbi:redoxin family protein [uncultured Microbulbifer sp.]|uniref:redoxin family protein n=1 Tax=uncultured Microbulbifer sp. TaxID=348147 RepID=UPI002612D484|nr:redoxin family protein [uncultured Microbulbifer sp.]
MQATLKKAPELHIQTWLNTNETLSLEKLKGKVIAIFAFQMLCPGCVEHSIPQAKKVYRLFNSNDLIVIGLHTVFENHEAMKEVSLRVFLHEYRIDFPVGIDMPSSDGSPNPMTMTAYQMGGTPTLILIDRNGYLRKKKFGHEHDLLLGAELASLISEQHLNNA